MGRRAVDHGIERRDLSSWCRRPEADVGDGARSVAFSSCPTSPPQRFDLTVDGRAHRVEITDGALRREIRWYVDDERGRADEVGRRQGDPQAGGRRPRPGGAAVLDAGPPAPGHLFEAGRGGGGQGRHGRRRHRPRPRARVARRGVRAEGAGAPAPVRRDPDRRRRGQGGRAAAAGLPAGAVHVLGAAARREPARASPGPTCPTCRRSRGRTSTCRTGRCRAGCARSWRRSKYVWPVVLAYVLARAEIRRRRKQDELKAGMRQQDERDDA